MKKIICLVLVLTMCVSLSSVLAMETDEADSVSYSEFLLSEENNIILICEDDSYGNTLYTVKEDGVITSTAYLNRAESTITETLYNKARMTETSIYTYTPVAYEPTEANLRAAFTRAGKILYKRFDGSLTYNESVYCDYSQSVNNSAQYNLNGNYKSLATLVATISGALALPNAIAQQVAAAVLSYFSYTVGTVSSYLIPDHWVSAVKTTVTWKASNTQSSAMSGTTTGSQYYVTETGYAGKTYNEGDFWPVSSFSNHNNRFAARMYQLAIGYDGIEVIGWTK